MHPLMIYSLSFMSLYRGRFAPSPTGLLHFGSLFAAVVSFLDARFHQGEWIIRIEDIDPLREEEGAAESILASLKSHSLDSDGAVIYQSKRNALYHKQLERLISDGIAFACPCSRKYLIEHQGKHQPACLDQTCDIKLCAYKFRSLHERNYTWDDGYQGKQSLALTEDFVLKRKEGFYAYQLAVVCDDLSQGITHVTRGYDLLDSTPMQLALYEAFKKRPPRYSHFPVITYSTGQKLSKQNRAPAINIHKPLENLLAVFSQLNLKLKHQPDTCKQALDEALENWNPILISGKSELKQDRPL